jgi:predicted metal-dependent hydrolase
VNQIIPRDLDVDFAQVPRHWMARSPIATAIANGVNLLFPHGERFFVRSVNQFRDQIDDPALRAAIKGFFGQEGRHAHAHDEFNAILRAQGFEIDRFLAGYKRVSSWLEAHLSPELNLATTAAAEHFTAILAEGAFSHDVLDQAAPEMRTLLAWHAAEEIEHKAVAFDVLQAIDPSYALRIAGLALATATLGGFWLWGAMTLLRQDRPAIRREWRQRRATRASGAGGGPPVRDPIIRRVFLRGIRQYLVRDFHPSRNATDTIAADWMAARGMSLPGATTEAA